MRISNVSAFWQRVCTFFFSDKHTAYEDYSEDEDMQMREKEAESDWHFEQCCEEEPLV